MRAYILAAALALLPINAWSGAGSLDGGKVQVTTGSVTAFQGGAWDFTATVSTVALKNISGAAIDPATDRTLSTEPSSTRLSDGAAFYKATTPADTQPVSAASLPLPSGAATAAKQDTGNASISSIDSKIPASPAQDRPTAASPAASRLTDGTAFYKATTPSDTQPISAASLPLPAGAATSALQTTGNTSMSSIDGKITTTANGIKTDGSAVTQPVSAASLPLPAGAATEATLTTKASESTLATRASEATLATRATEATAATLFKAGQSAVVSTGSITAFQGGQSYIVSGLTSVGVAPALNPVSVSGIDGAGLKRHLLTDGSGRLSISSGALNIGTVSGSTVTAFQGGSPWSVNIVGASNNKFYAVAPGLLNAAVAAADNPLLMLVNLSTNTLSARIIFRTMGCDVTNVQVTYRLWINPVVTSSGTYLAPVAIYQTGVPASQIQAFTLPTLSSLGMAIENVSQGQNTAAALLQDNQSISIDPGNRLLITANPSSNNRGQWVSIKWLEQ